MSDESSINDNIELSEEQFVQAIQDALARKAASFKPSWSWKNNRLVLTQPDDNDDDSESRTKVHNESIVPGRRKFLDFADEQIQECPTLSQVFDSANRKRIRDRVLSANQYQIASYPAVYGLLMEIMSDRCSADLLENIETALALAFDRLNTKDRNRLFHRLRETDSLAAEEELLALAGFVREFGVESIKFPTESANSRKPEFYVGTGENKIAVECKGLFEKKAIQQLNEHMVATGQPWCSFGFDDEHDISRFRDQLVKKIKKNQGNGPTVLVFTLYTAWVQPEWAADVVKAIITAPASFKLDPDELPIAIALIAQRRTQGIWLNQKKLSTTSFPLEFGEQIRNAVKQGFQLRQDQLVLTEADWISEES